MKRRSKTKSGVPIEAVERVLNHLKDPKNFNPMPKGALLSKMLADKPNAAEIKQVIENFDKGFTAHMPFRDGNAIDAIFTGISFRAGKDEAIRRVRDYVIEQRKQVHIEAEKNSTLWIQDKNAEIRQRDNEIAKLQRSIRLLNDHRASEVIAACGDPYANQVEVGERR